MLKAKNIFFTLLALIGLAGIITEKIVSLGLIFPVVIIAVIMLLICGIMLYYESV